MTKIVWISAIVFLVAVLAAGGYYAWNIYVAFHDLCSVEVGDKIPAPDNEHVAVVFEKDCGATTPFNTQVSVTRSMSDFYAGRASLAVVIRGKYGLPVEWLNSRRVEVWLPKGEKIFRQNSVSDGISFVYGSVEKPADSAP